MIYTETTHTGTIDEGSTNARLIEAELKIWKKISDVAYAEAKHPDEVYADFMVMFSEFIEKKFPVTKYPTEKSAGELIKQISRRKIKKTSQKE